MCLPLDGSGIPHALEEHDKPPVHVFFPTDETVGARAIVHASLDVTENRKHFRASERNALVYPRMRELIVEIIAAIPAEAALDAFGSIDPKSASGAARDLASKMLEAVKETPFPDHRRRKGTAARRLGLARKVRHDPSARCGRAEDLPPSPSFRERPQRPAAGAAG